MNNKTRFVITSSLLGLLCWQSLVPALGCSFSTDPYFTYTNHPDFPLKKYAAGELGILQSGYARSYLLPAYRYLSGAPLSADEQQGLVSLWDYRLTNTDTPCPADTSAWLKARVTVPGAPKIDSIDTERPISKEDSWQTYCNCQTNAFQAASQTLAALTTKYGADSKPVKEWLADQDKVFSNCGYPSYQEHPKPEQIPSPLPAGSDPQLLKQNAYQIAAANFYAQHFDVARNMFDAIAKDPQSPWQHISGYLAVRSMIRQASLSKPEDKKLLSEAQTRLREMASSPDYASMSKDLTSLESFISARLTPEQHVQEIAKEKITAESAGELTKTIDLLIGDQGDGGDGVKYASLPPSVKSPEMVDWIMSFQSTDDVGHKHAIERWKQTHSLPWLVAAATAVQPGDVNAPAIVKAADEHQEGPAHWTLFYNSNRMKLASGKGDVVREALDKVLSAPPADLPISSLNELKTQRLVLARNLDEFVRFGAQRPAAIVTSGFIEQVPENVSDLESGTAKPEKPLFTQEAGNVMDNKLPLASLKELAKINQLQNALRGNVAWTSWVRAVLINDEANARALAELARPFNKAKDKYFAAYLAAPDAEARKFAAVFLMLHFSSAQPNPTWGVLNDDSYGDSSGWWWGKNPVVSFDRDGDWGPGLTENIDPLFLTPQQKAQAKQELAKLANLATAPDYFAKTVLAWAKSHPNDERVPEALHWTVKATHYGMTDEATSAYSKEAFQLLHSKYKASPWTKKTPYYY